MNKEWSDTSFSEGATGYESIRVAIISHNHPSISKGGAEIAAYSLFQGLQKIGVYAIFIAMCAEDKHQAVRLGSSKEYVVLHRPEAYEHFYHIGSTETPNIINKILEAERISVVNFHHFFLLGLNAVRLALAGQKVKKVMTFHEFLAICHHHGQMITRQRQSLCDEASPAACAVCYPEYTRQQFAIRKSRFLSALSEVDCYVSPSSFLAERFMKWGLPDGRMTIIENGLPTPPKQRVNVIDAGKTHWTFGFFGQINPFKGVDLLLQAAELLRRDKRFKLKINIRLHGNLVGQSDEFVSQFKRAVQGDSVLSWSGAYENSQVNRLMGDCDYVLMPSRWWENSPVVIQEAFAVGRPVICSGIGGMAEKVSDGINGFHFRVNDHYDLVNVMKKAADKDVYTALQSNLPKPYDALEMARRYMKVFSEDLNCYASSLLSRDV